MRRKMSNFIFLNFSVILIRIPFKNIYNVAHIGIIDAHVKNQ